MKHVLLTSGLGDQFAIFSHIAPETIDAIETVWIATPAAKWIAEYCRLTMRADVRILSDGKRGYFSLADVEQRHGPLPGVTDLSVRTIFPQLKTFYGSPLLRLPLTESEYAGWYALVPWSVNDDGHRRNWNNAEWIAVDKRLADEGKKGVILYSGPLHHPKRFPRIVDLTNQTNLEQSVNILRQCGGMISVDSCFACLGCQCLDNLTVKSVNKFYHEWLNVYCAPRTDFSFVTQNLAADPTNNVNRTRLI